MEKSFKPKISNSIIIRKESFGAFLYNKDRGVTDKVNNDAMKFLKLCNGKNTMEYICAKLSEISETPLHEIVSVVEELTKNLISRKVIEPHTKDVRHKVIEFQPLTKVNDIPYFEDEDHLDLGLKEDEILSAPLHVSIGITSRCNLKCLHCYAQANECGKKEISTEEILDFIDQMGSMQVFSTAISGGEPLLRKDLAEIVRGYKSHNMQVLLSTNGMLFTGEYAKKLKEAGVDSIQFSVDGFEDTHDSFRRVKGSYSKVINAIKLAVKERFKIVRVATCVNKTNLNEIADLIDLFADLGVNVHRLLRFMPVGRGKGRHEYEITNDEIKRLMRKVEEKTGGTGERCLSRFQTHLIRR
jgi:uncharacterized radical SAM superfamily Fe-S cluster-containing enzyme